MITIRNATLALLLALAAGFMASAQDMAMSEATLTLGEHDVIGEYLADGEGRTLYVVVDDEGQPVHCAGACAEAWPPFLVEGMMANDAMSGDSEMAEGDMAGGAMEGAAMAGDAVVGEGVDPSLLGTVERDDGSLQWTYDGLPLYYFVNDVEAEEVNCQAVAQFDGTWYVLYGDGGINRTAP
jgi:predicted lipoprotein with Yx(FWY)xxD motif